MLEPPVLGVLDKTEVAIKQREGGVLPPIELWSYKTLINAFFWEPSFPNVRQPTSDSDDSDTDEEEYSTIHQHRNRRKRYDAMRVAELLVLYFSESPWEKQRKVARVKPLNVASF